MSADATVVAAEDNIEETEAEKPEEETDQADLVRNT